MSHVNYILPPVMSQQAFADLLGVTKDTVRGWKDNDSVPTVKIGKQVFVNTQLMAEHIRQGKEIFSKEDYSDS